MKAFILVFEGTSGLVSNLPEYTGYIMEAQRLFAPTDSLLSSRMADWDYRNRHPSDIINLEYVILPRNARIQTIPLEWEEF